MKTCGVVYFAQNDTKRSRSRAAAWGDLLCRALPNFRRLRWHWHTPESDLLLTWGEIHLGKQWKHQTHPHCLLVNPKNYLNFWQFFWFHPYLWFELLWVGQQSPLLIQVAIGKSCWTCKILLKFFQRISILLVGEKDSNSKPYNPALVELQHLKVVKNPLKFAIGKFHTTLWISMGRSLLGINNSTLVTLTIQMSNVTAQMICKISCKALFNSFGFSWPQLGVKQELISMTITLRWT